MPGTTMSTPLWNSEPLQGVAVVLLAGDDLDLRRVGPGRHLAQELEQDVAGLRARSASCQRSRSVGTGQSGSFRWRNDSGTSAHGSPWGSPPRADCGLTRTWADAGPIQAARASSRMAARERRHGDWPPRGGTGRPSREPGLGGRLTAGPPGPTIVITRITVRPTPCTRHVPDYGDRHEPCPRGCGRATTNEALSRGPEGHGIDRRAARDMLAARPVGRGGRAVPFVDPSRAGTWAAEVSSAPRRRCTRPKMSGRGITDNCRDSASTQAAGMRGRRRKGKPPPRRLRHDRLRPQACPRLSLDGQSAASPNVLNTITVPAGPAVCPLHPHRWQARSTPRRRLDRRPPGRPRPAAPPPSRPSDFRAAARPDGPGLQALKNRAWIATRHHRGEQREQGDFDHWAGPRWQSNKSLLRLNATPVTDSMPRVRPRRARRRPRPPCVADARPCRWSTATTRRDPIGTGEKNRVSR